MNHTGTVDFGLGKRNKTDPICFFSIDAVRWEAVWGQWGSILSILLVGKSWRQLPKSDGSQLRLRTMGAGTLVGEIGLYTEKPRSAHAVADRASILNVLTYERFKALEDKFPDISRQFHKFVVRSLAFHMAQDSKAMRVLLV